MTLLVKYCSLALVLLLCADCKRETIEVEDYLAANNTYTPLGEGYILFNDVNYELSEGEVRNYGKIDSLYNFDLSLYSKNYTFNADQKFYEGSGTSLYLEIFSLNDSLYSESPYKFSAVRIRNSFDAGFINISSFIEYAEIYDGSIIIEKDGNQYNLSFNLSADNFGNDIIITGEYSGYLRNTNYLGIN